MKSKLLFFAVFIFCSLFSIAQEEPTEELVKVEMENGIVNFVSAVKNTLPSSEYNSFDEFRMSLIGEVNVGSITTAGNALLQVTYDLIQSDASEEDIKENGWRPFAAATKIVLEYELDHKISDQNLAIGSIYLFGGEAGSILDFADPDTQPTCGEMKECKWYQFGCYLHNLSVFFCRNKEIILKLIEHLK